MTMALSTEELVTYSCQLYDVKVNITPSRKPSFQKKVLKGAQSEV